VHNIAEFFKTTVGILRGVGDFLPLSQRASPDLDALDLAGNDELADFLRTGAEFIPVDDRIRNAQSIRDAQNRTINVPLDSEGRIIFTPDPDLPGEATFEPDPLGIPDTGTAEEKRTEKEPGMIGILPVLARGAVPILQGAGAFVLADLVGTAIGGTQMGPIAPATTPTLDQTEINMFRVGEDIGGGLGSLSAAAFGSGAPTAAQVRQLLLRKVGLRAGRRGPVPYTTFRRIIRDMGEVAGGQCMGLSASEVCFLYMNAPKRRGRSITPKQINRSMSALRRVKALNKSVRKALPGCKI